MTGELPGQRLASPDSAILNSYLEWHKEYWTADEKMAAKVSGLVALGPLAIACLAYDEGTPIEVESGYLPKYLLERGRVGDFPT